MRLAIIDDEGTIHDIEDVLEELDWYDPQVVRELIEEIRQTANMIEEGDNDGFD